MDPKKALVLALFVALAPEASAQNSIFKEAIKMRESVNSSANETFPFISENGQILFFVRDKGKKPGQAMWYSAKNKGKEWKQAIQHLEKWQGKHLEVMGTSKKGRRLFLSTKPASSKDKTKGVSYIEWYKGRWLTPKPLKVVIPSEAVVDGLYINTEEDVLLMSMVDGLSLGKQDLYVSLKDDSGTWGYPIHLGNKINTEGQELSPFLTEDKKILYFSSDGHPGYGNTDIFFTERQDSTWENWSVPINMGDRINSQGNDTYFSITSSQEMYFASDREQADQMDIYYSKVLTPGVPDTAYNIHLPPDTLTVEVDPNQAQSELAKQKSAELVKLETIIVLFNSNSDKFLDLFADKLNKMADYVHKKPSTKIKLAGYTDNLGSKAYNLKLSVKRAGTIKRYLLNKGLDEDEIIVVGYGEANPIAPNDTPSGRYQNRRVEASLIDEESYNRP